MQSRIRQARRAKKYMFGYLIPRSYEEALEFDKENNNTKWADATRKKWTASKNNKYSQNTKGSNGIQNTSES